MAEDNNSKILLNKAEFSLKFQSNLNSEAELTQSCQNIKNEFDKP